MYTDFVWLQLILKSFKLYTSNLFPIKEPFFFAQRNKYIVSKISYLKMSARMKVRAGRALTVADANVAEVYFIPK